MNDAVAALLGAAIGATAGLVGGALAALAALRTSQISARAPLAPLLHELARQVVTLRANADTPDEPAFRLAYEAAWNDFRVHQQILCPSSRIELMSYLVQRVSRERALPPAAAVDLAGQFLDKITRMVAAHSDHLFRWRAVRREGEILREWLASPESQLLSPEMRAKLGEVGRRPQSIGA